ncbi:MAG: response regulator [Burkholderiales bacterium]|nr:response regulator [Burkholderiales bacterium]
MIKTMAAEVVILLVEDNPGDVLLTKEALAEGKVANSVQWVKDGDEAIAFLTRQGNYADAPQPDVILLDLNLPRKSGHEVLAFVKSHQHLKRIPVVILTSSKAESDILLSYDNYANCYVTKPVDLDKFMSIVHAIDYFWLKVVRLPSEEYDV